MSSEIFAGRHAFSKSSDPDDDRFIVFKVEGLWYWTRVAPHSRTLRGMPQGPFPTAEGAYLHAQED